MALALALDPAAGANTSRTRTFCRFDALTSFGTLCVFVCGSRFQCSAGCNESSRVCSKSWTNSRDSRESFCDSWKLWNYKEVNTVMRHYVWDSRVEESVSQHTLAAINCSRDNLVLWDIFETPTQSPNWFLTLSNKVSNVSFFFFSIFRIVELFSHTLTAFSWKSPHRGRLLFRTERTFLVHSTANEDSKTRRDVTALTKDRIDRTWNGTSCLGVWNTELGKISLFFCFFFFSVF